MMATNSPSPRRSTSPSPRRSTSPSPPQSTSPSPPQSVKRGRATLLLEIGCEELPPRDLRRLSEAFAARVAEGLAAAGVVGDGDNATADYRAFATPRRLAVAVKAVASRAPSRVIERRGPAVRAAFDAGGEPTRAALGFAKSCGVEVAQLARITTGKGEHLAHRQRQAGAGLAAIVTDCLADAVRRLPVAKSMRWGDGDAEFARPAHWLLALHGRRVLATTTLGLPAGRQTRGHRFHGGAEPISIAEAGDYEAALKSRGRVIADFGRRRGVIARQLARLAAAAGARPPVDDALLDEVAGLVEWPQAVAGAFERRFLKLPPEALIECMRAQQKFFPLTDARGKLLPAFIAVSNLTGKPGARVRAGYERVLRARLADAEFFWRSDAATALESRLDALRGMRFHHRLGTLLDKTRRIADAAAGIAAQLGDGDAGITAARRAATLCKADLATAMVGEFPALQGVIGRRIARAGGESAAVADAIEQHYRPRFAGDKLPAGRPAQCVALADRLDSLLGLFACGDAPSGDKDPFALRRAALGILRILIQKRLDLDVLELLELSARAFAGDGDGDGDGAGDVAAAPDARAVEAVFDFILHRLPAHYQPLGFSALEVAAVLACRPRRPLDFDRRLRALSRFFKAQPAAAESLAAANKRIAGILSKSAGDDDTVTAAVDESLFRHAAEVELAHQLQALGARARAAFEAGEYDAGLRALSKLRRPIDAFFDAVMVMDEDAKLRANRLALLAQIRALFLRAADISVMQTET